MAARLRPGIGAWVLAALAHALLLPVVASLWRPAQPPIPGESAPVLQVQAVSVAQPSVLVPIPHPPAAPAPVPKLVAAAPRKQVASSASEPQRPAAAWPQMASAWGVQGTTQGVAWQSRAELVVKREEDKYAISWQVGRWGAGARVFTSVGQFGASGFVPERYSERGRSEQAVHMDAAASTVRFSHSQAVLPRPDGLQDRLSVAWQLALVLAQTPSLQRTGAQWQQPTASLGGVADWLFVARPLAVDAQGRPTVLRFSRSARHLHDADLHLTYAQACAWCLVRWESVRERGDSVVIEAMQPDLNLERLPQIHAHKLPATDAQ